VARLISIDGKDFGVLLQSQVGSMGETVAITSRPEWLEKYYVYYDEKVGRALLKRLLQKREVDPKSLKVFLGLLRTTYDEVRIPPNSVLNVGASSPDAIIVLVDSKGNPVPLDALLSPSAKERDRLSSLFRYYSAFVHHAYPLMQRELDLYRKTVYYYQLLLNTRDHEVDALMEANARALQVMKNLQGMVTSLNAQLILLEELLDATSKEADKWREAAQRAISEVIPKMSELVYALGTEISRGMTTLMKQHAAELSQSAAFRDTVQALLERIKETEQQYMKEISRIITEMRRPPKVVEMPVPSPGEKSEEEKTEGGES